MLTQEQLLNAKILIVDDQQSNVLLLEKMLRASGYTAIQSTTDSREVSRLYEEFQPDLILLDLNMPYVNGFQVMSQLKLIERDTYLPILVLTADTSRSIRLRALESGAKDFLTKPFDSIEVLTRIHNMLEVRLLQNEIRDQNKILEEKVQERTKELRETRLEIIHRLGLAAEYRDDDTGFHTIRMSRYCSQLASAYGLDKTTCQMILTASPMHDIGKIGIPDRVLLKPGKLDSEEWEIIKTHSDIGARILSGSQSELLQMAETIALTHHEKWDGSGYPRGLKGEQIPLVGRISAVCDVFDALTSERPYKKAWSIDEAVVEIERCRSKHFDPRLIDIFIHILPDILEIRKQFIEANPTKFWHKLPLSS
jgi:putative two-component system response regulator